MFAAAPFHFSQHNAQSRRAGTKQARQIWNPKTGAANVQSYQLSAISFQLVGENV